MQLAHHLQVGLVRQADLCDQYSTDHVGISHVTGSSYFVRALHEVVNIMVRDALLGMCAVPCICVACVEKCMLCV